jgi:hypothetical protein
MTEGSFPILFPLSADRRELERAGVVVPRSIPWSLIAPHERQAERNHYQTLKRLAERGGLSPSEACAVLEDRAWHKMEEAAAIARLAEIVTAAVRA